MLKRLSSWIAGFSAAICILAFPVQGRAQGSTWVGASLAQYLDTARWRLGPLRGNASLTLADVGYDTDVYYGFLDSPVPDFGLRASVPVQVLIPLGKQTILELDDTPEYLFYIKTRNERDWNNIFGGHVHFFLKRFYAQSGGELSNVRRRMSPELDVYIREKSDRLNGTLLWQPSRIMSFAGLFEHSRYNYGNSEFGGINISETLNREESYLDLISYMQLSSKVRLFADGQYGSFVFTEPSAKIRDTRSYGIYGGITFVTRQSEIRPIAPPQGSVSLGYKRFNIINPTLKDGAGLVGVINVSTGLFRRTIIRASFLRDFEFSVYSGATFYLSTAYGGGFSRQLSRRTTFSYDLTFSRGSYNEEGYVVTPAGQEFRYLNHAFRLNVRLARHMGVTFEALLTQRELGGGGAKRIRNFFGLSLIYGSPAGSIFAPVRGLALGQQNVIGLSN